MTKFLENIIFGNRKVVVALFILLTIVFAVIRIMPGDPVSAMLGGHAPERLGESRPRSLLLRDDEPARPR